MGENPWAYREAQNRIREQQEKEKEKKEQLSEDFEKTRSKVSVEKQFDIFELKRRIETGRSLSVLRHDIDTALREWLISRKTFDKIEKALDVRLDPEKDRQLVEKRESGESDYVAPFSDGELAKFFEDKRIGENVFVDMAGFSYGFFVQWGAIMVILAWRIFLDMLFLPRDILEEIREYNK